MQGCHHVLQIIGEILTENESAVWTQNVSELTKKNEMYGHTLFVALI